MKISEKRKRPLLAVAAVVIIGAAVIMTGCSNSSSNGDEAGKAFRKFYKSEVTQSGLVYSKSGGTKVTGSYNGSLPDGIVAGRRTDPEGGDPMLVISRTAQGSEAGNPVIVNDVYSYSGGKVKKIGSAPDGSSSVIQELSNKGDNFRTNTFIEKGKDHTYLVTESWYKADGNISFMESIYQLGKNGMSKKEDITLASGSAGSIRSTLKKYGLEDTVKKDGVPKFSHDGDLMISRSSAEYDGNYSIKGGSDYKVKINRKNKEQKRVYSAYREVLSKNKSAIKAYNWQTDPGKDKPDNGDGIGRPVALCDINGDGIPELFFMSADSYNGSDAYVAELHIYTYENGQAEEVEYSLGHDQNDYSLKLTDALAGGGMSYCVYKGDENGTFYIYSSISDEGIEYYIDTFKMDGTSCTATDHLVNDYYPDTDSEEPQMKDEYYHNGSSVSKSEGESLFSGTFGRLSNAIIYSGSTYDSKLSLWKKFDKSDALCMSYDDAYSKLG